MTQFVDKEDLSKNTLLEIDLAEMTQNHLTGADLSCGLFVSTKMMMMMIIIIIIIIIT